MLSLDFKSGAIRKNVNPFNRKTGREESSKNLELICSNYYFRKSDSSKMGSSPTKLSVIENGRTIIDIGTWSRSGIDTVIPAGSLLPITWRTTKTFKQVGKQGA